MDDRQQEQQLRHLESLRAFVLRARRVWEHSFVQDEDAMAKFRRPQWHMERNADGTFAIITELPPEEVIESLAARVRAYLLTEDPTHHPKFMNALLSLARQNDSPQELIDALRVWKKAWEDIHPRSTSHHSYAVHVQKGDEPAQRLSDTELAFSWMFGDVMHATATRRAAGKAFGVKERFRAAVPLVIRLADLSNGVLGFIEALREVGGLRELDEVFEEEVVVGSLEVRQEGTLLSADASAVTEEPSLDRELGDEWAEWSGGDATLTANEDREKPFTKE